MYLKTLRDPFNSASRPGISSSLGKCLVNTGDLAGKPKNYQNKSGDLLDALPAMCPDVLLAE